MSPHIASARSAPRNGELSINLISRAIANVSPQRQTFGEIEHIAHGKVDNRLALRRQSVKPSPFSAAMRRGLVFLPADQVPFLAHRFEALVHNGNKNPTAGPRFELAGYGRSVGVVRLLQPHHSEQDHRLETPEIVSLGHLALNRYEQWYAHAGRGQKSGNHRKHPEPY